MDVEELEKNWTERGFSFGVGTIKAGDAVVEAFHKDKDELVLMESGEYEFSIDNESFKQNGNVEKALTDYSGAAPSKDEMADIRALILKKNQDKEE